jgi:energy-coupling factor transporter ATP-binding protein EcfA2
MPKATNLIEAYNNFVVEPLKTEEEFRDFYVARPKNAPSPIEELKDRMENAESAKKYLFLGFRGCGKSTELNRLFRLLDRDKFLIVSYSIRDELDVSDFDFRDFFASMALKIYDTAEKEIELERDIKEDFRDFMMHITKVSEEDITRYREMGISFSKFILLKLGREAKTREYIRKELETKISDLIQRLKWLTMEVESKLNKKVVVIVDDLDKLARGQQAEDFFYKNYGLLIQPNCFVIYTFPIPLTFNPYYENVRHAFDDDIILPQLPVRSRDRKRINEENFNFYKRIVKKRMDLGLIEEEALKDAILSTGKTSEFISVMRDAAIKAYRNEKDKITKEEVGKALEKLRRTYDRTLTEAHKKRLLEIYDKKEARDENTNDSTSRDLLFSLTAVEYEDEEGRWCDINPLLMPLVEKWKKA